MWQSFSLLRCPLSKQKDRGTGYWHLPRHRLEAKWRVAKGREDQHGDQEAGHKDDGWPGF